MAERYMTAGWLPVRRRRLGSEERSRPIRWLLFLLGAQTRPVDLLRLQEAESESDRLLPEDGG
jgi:hypothetical protein